jgi:hypothetical protein
MKKIIITFLIFFVSISYCEAQSGTSLQNLSRRETRKDVRRAKHLTDTTTVINKVKEDRKEVDCHCAGTSFDTCCLPKKICCQTELIKDAANNKRGNKYTNYTLQKNFADASPFYFEDFYLKYGKSNLCIRVCNINRMVFNITSKGVVQSVKLIDSVNIFDALAKSYKEAATVTIKTDSTKGQSPKESVEPSGEKNIAKAKLKKKSDLDILKESIGNKKNSINALTRQMQNDLKKLNDFAKFAKNVPVIIGSEPYYQQNIKKRLGNEINIKSFNPDITYENLENIINTEVPELFERAKEKLEAIDELKNEISKEIADYRKKNDDSRITLTEFNELNTLSNLDKETDKIISVATKVDKEELKKSIETINNLLAGVNNDSNFFYTQCFGRGDGEMVNLEFKATPKEIYKNKIDSQEYKYSVPVKGCFKWAIGPSLNFHFGGTLLNSTYSLDSTRNAAGVIMKDTFLISENSKRSRVVPYIGFMVHFYWQTNKPLTPGINIGVSTSPTQLSDLRTYLGGSVIIGGPIKGKLIFSAGLAGAAVDRLKPNLIEGFNPKSRIVFNGNNLPNPDQLVDKVFRIGFFFGMTYNLKD